MISKRDFNALRDRLLCGIHCSSTQKRLLSEKDLDLDKALAITISMETAAKDASEVKKKKTVENEMHKISLIMQKSRNATVVGTPLMMQMTVGSKKRPAESASAKAT